MARKFRVPVPALPKKKYTISIKNSNVKIEVNPDGLPYGSHGLPGSILDIVGHVDEDSIDHACGGVQACSTCHVYVTGGFNDCNETSEREEDYLDKARGTKMNSRLACCCVPDGTSDIEIEVPKWNVNMVKEGA